VLGSVLTAVYRGGVRVPTGVEPVGAHAAEETLGGAVTTAAGLPGHDGEVLLASARAAFVSAIDVAALVGAGVVVAVALVVVLSLRTRAR
jgi:DHA2 family multidrug resistance protein-like MFS transporter